MENEEEGFSSPTLDLDLALQKKHQSMLERLRQSSAAARPGPHVLFKSAYTIRGGDGLADGVLSLLIIFSNRARTEIGEDDSLRNLSGFSVSGVSFSITGHRGVKEGVERKIVKRVAEWKECFLEGKDESFGFGEREGERRVKEEEAESVASGGIVI